MNPTDLITVGVGIVEKLIELHRIEKWAKLFFSFGFTYVTAYSGACGAALLHGSGWLPSVGAGLTSATGACLALFAVHPQTRGILITQDKKNLPSVDLSDYQNLEKH